MIYTLYTNTLYTNTSHLYVCYIPYTLYTTLYKLCIHYIYYTICRWDAYVTGVIFASELRLLGARRAEDIYAEAGVCI